MSEYLTIPAFARRRQVATTAVRKAISNGRLKKSIRRDARGRVEIHVEDGDREWIENRDISKVRPPNAKRRRRYVSFDDLHPAVGGLYKIRQHLGAFTTAVWRMSGPEKDCRAILEASRPSRRTCA